MFTGLITDVGRIVEVSPFGGGVELGIASSYDPYGIAVGASIACAGVCLTVEEVEATVYGARFSVKASAETIDKTTVGTWALGEEVNLERSMRLGDEMGGHLVSGHVDGRAKIIERHDEEDMSVFRFAPPAELRGLIAGKGSVALDGTSLTVNSADDTFTVALIPHTLTVTTWYERQVGDLVNIEVDMLARYVARLTSVSERG